MSKLYKYIFGPVPSRRLGLSLGIDLLGDKICSMDCIYCEVGKTKLHTIDRKEYVPTDVVILELKEYLENIKSEKPDYITFSGMGEPTLHSKIGFIIDEIHKITDIPVCVLTNSTTIVIDDVYKDLLKADLVIPSLDGISEEVIKSINKPVGIINYNKIVHKLAEFKKQFKGKLLIEILFVKGVNDSIDELNLLREAIKLINPDGLQIHTVARPSLSGRVEKVSDLFLENARLMLGNYQTGEFIYSKKNKMNSNSNEDLIISLLKIRSCHFEEIINSTGISKEKLITLLDKLEKSGNLSKIDFEGMVYYKVLLDKRT